MVLNADRTFWWVCVLPNPRADWLLLSICNMFLAYCKSEIVKYLDNNVYSNVLQWQWVCSLGSDQILHFRNLKGKENSHVSPFPWHCVSCFVGSLLSNFQAYLKKRSWIALQKKTYRSINSVHASVLWSCNAVPVPLRGIVLISWNRSSLFSNNIL